MVGHIDVSCQGSPRPSETHRPIITSNVPLCGHAFDAFPELGMCVPTVHFRAQPLHKKLSAQEALHENRPKDIADKTFTDATCLM